MKISRSVRSFFATRYSQLAIFEGATERRYEKQDVRSAAANASGGALTVQSASAEAGVRSKK
jgi:hypothetical protein